MNKLGMCLSDLFTLFFSWWPGLVLRPSLSHASLDNFQVWFSTAVKRSTFMHGVGINDRFPRLTSRVFVDAQVSLEEWDSFLESLRTLLLRSPLSGHRFICWWNDVGPGSVHNTSCRISWFRDPLISLLCDREKQSINPPVAWLWWICESAWNFAGAP